MNWREFISGVYEHQMHGPEIRTRPAFYPPALKREIVDLESQLHATLPSSLRSLLFETNGVMDTMALDGGEWFDSNWLVWPTVQIIKENLFFRGERTKGTYNRAFDEVLFFANAGSDGILFAHPIMKDRITSPDIVVWHPMEDELKQMATSLKDFMERWLTGAISV